MTKVFDYKPETKSLIADLIEAGWYPVKGNNGGDESFKPGDFKTMDEFIEELLACDEAALGVRRQSGDAPFTLYLVLGNSPGELVADHSTRRDTYGEAFDAVVRAHGDKWDGKPQPMAVRCTFSVDGTWDSKVFPTEAEAEAYIAGLRAAGAKEVKVASR